MVLFFLLKMWIFKLISSIILLSVSSSIKTEQEDGKKLEKPVFFPAFMIPVYHSLAQDIENYPGLTNDQTVQEYHDALPKMFLNRNSLKSLLYADGRNKKTSPKHDINEDGYRTYANSIANGMIAEKPLFEEFYERNKRSLSYPSWSLPPALPGNNNYLNEGLEDRPVNTKAVSVQLPIAQPFGPYTTWLPYNGPKIMSSQGSQPYDPISNSNNDQATKIRARRDTKQQQSVVVDPTPRAGRSPDWPQISFPHPVFPMAPVVHGMHHIISPHGPIIPTPIKDAALHVMVHNPAYALAYNVGFL